MHDVLRQDLLAGDAVREPVRGRRVAPIEVVERPTVAREQPTVQLQVLLVPVPHGGDGSIARCWCGCIRDPDATCVTSLER